MQVLSIAYQILSRFQSAHFDINNVTLLLTVSLTDCENPVSKNHHGSTVRCQLSNGQRDFRSMIYGGVFSIVTFLGTIL